MSQYAYILVVLSLVFLFLLNKYEKERLQRLYQEQLLKDETFRSDIKEKIHTTENINDVIAHINKTYHLGMLLSKDITEQLKWPKSEKETSRIFIRPSQHHPFETTTVIFIWFLWIFSGFPNFFQNILAFLLSFL